MDLMKTMEEMGGFSFDFNNDDYEADDSEPPYQKQTEDYFRKLKIEIPMKQKIQDLILMPFERNRWR